MSATVMSRTMANHELTMMVHKGNYELTMSWCALGEIMVAMSQKWNPKPAKGLPE